jgi:hypothetical protein
MTDIGTKLRVTVEALDVKDAGRGFSYRVDRVCVYPTAVEAYGPVAHWRVPTDFYHMVRVEALEEEA